MMEEAMLSEHVISSEQLYKGKILNVQKWMVTLPNGAQALREVVLHPGASAVVPVDDEGNTYLVRQYRAPLGEILTEIPAGKLDVAGESRLEAAKRELREETGFTASSWRHLTDIYTTPGFCNEKISIYLAMGLTKGESEHDEDEFLDLVKMPLKDAVALVKGGKLNDSKTITGLLLAQSALDGEANG